MSAQKTRGSRAAEKAELLREARADWFRLHRCPICGYESCLLGVLSHAVSKHRVNLVAKACRRAPLHRHKGRKGRETSLRFTLGE
jgi:hypothetical protein